MCSLFGIRPLVVAVLLMTAVLLMAACGTSAPADAVHESDSSVAAEAESDGMVQQAVVAVNFTNDQLSPETIRVKQGDNVTLNLNTDRPGSFHIHGYDLEKKAAVGEVTAFQFKANATGRFGINFHGVAYPRADSSDMEGMDTDSPDHHAPGETMDHGPAESAVPVSIDIAAEVAENGGIHVNVGTDGWRWAPEEVNGTNSDGAGHAHIYADGVKLTRVYGGYHYLAALEPGARNIKVSLNTNDHSELTWQGSKLESAVTLTVPELPASGHSGMDARPGPVDAGAPMSVEVIVHEDALGGYNVQAVARGFEFSQSADGGHEPGQGYAQLSVNGEVFNRLYVPWLQVPAQGEGMHTFTVALFNNEGQPYHYGGKPVETAITVLEEAKVEDAAASQAGDSHQHGSGPGASTDHHGGGATNGAADIVELEIGYLEVLP